MQYEVETFLKLNYGRMDWVKISYTLDLFSDEPYDVAVYDENGDDVTDYAHDMDDHQVAAAVMADIAATNAQRGRDLAKAAKENAQ
jgi:hypothetical protein